MRLSTNAAFLRLVYKSQNDLYVKRKSPYFRLIVVVFFFFMISTISFVNKDPMNVSRFLFGLNAAQNIALK